MKLVNAHKKISVCDSNEESGIGFMNIGIVSVGFGSVEAVVQAFRSIDESAATVCNSEEVAKMDCLIIPGVGSFPNAMKNLKKSGVLESLKTHIKSGKPVLGICLGFQLLFDSSKEGGESVYTRGLGLFSETVEPICSNFEMKTGWFQVKPQVMPVGGDFYYFNHRFGVKRMNKENVVSVCEDGVIAEVRKDNIRGVQFHPEKSQFAGRRYLRGVIEDWS